MCQKNFEPAQTDEAVYTAQPDGTANKMLADSDLEQISGGSRMWLGGECPICGAKLQGINRVCPTPGCNYVMGS